MIRTHKTSFQVLLVGLMLMLAGSVSASVQKEKVRISPASGIPMDTHCTRTRTTFRTTGDSKRGENPFQEFDFTKQTKQATGQTESMASAMDPEIKAMVEALGNPLYMRSLENKKAGHAPSGRVPML
ncbi:MAG: hypothetical protein KAH24_10365, partial [Holophagae bacterium]|nr:hypothetical protein [Holophagae bacterium]